MMSNRHIPTYSLDSFSKAKEKSQLFQVEVFDANRHFQVSYPHRHDFYEVLLIIKGSGIHLIDSKEYEILPPCMFFMSPGQTHWLELSNDIDGFIFLFTAEFYLLNQANHNRLLEFPFFFSVNQDNPPLHLMETRNVEFLKSLFERGCAEIAKPAFATDEIIRSLLDLILLSAVQLYPRSAQVQKSRGHILVKNFLQMLEKNYQRNLRVNDYAAILAVTANHLTQVVRQFTGKTPSEIIQEKVTLEIKRLLLHTSLTVNEIAESMNFADNSYFTKYFKKRTSMTPLQFRRNNLK